MATSNRLTRRDWMKTTGGALLAASALGAGADDLKAKAKKNIKLGMTSSVYGQFPVEEAARRMKADGFTGVLTDYAFADARFDPLAPNWDVAKKIVDGLEKNGIQIAATFGYYNVVDPNVEHRKRGEARIECLITNWKRLGCPNVSTETGTFNRQSEWVESPENATEQGYLQCRAVFERLARTAEKAGSMVSIEAYWRNVIDSIDRAERLFREVNSPALKLVMDPCNYFRKEDLPRVAPMLQDMFRRLGDRIVIAHAKDMRASADGVDHPAAGQGVLDYPLFLRLLAGLDREIHLILEHLSLPDVPRARDFVLAQMEKI